MGLFRGVLVHVDCPIDILLGHDFILYAYMPRLLMVHQMTTLSLLALMLNICINMSIYLPAIHSLMILYLVHRYRASHFGSGRGGSAVTGRSV